MSMKNPLIPAGIEPATFRFVAQHLKHCATAVPTVFPRDIVCLRNISINMLHKGDDGDDDDDDNNNNNK